MSKRIFLVDIDLSKNQLLNTRLQNLTTNPTLTANDGGYVYFNTVDKLGYLFNGTTFVQLTYVHPNHTGDVVSVGDGITTIANNVVSNTKLSTVSQNIIKGRISTGSGNVEDLTATQVRTIINVADGSQPTSAALVEAAGAVMKSHYGVNTILVSNITGTPYQLAVTTNSIIGRISGNIQNITLDDDLTSVSASHNTVPTALAVQEYVNTIASPTGHTHYQLHQPNGINPFVYTDNSGNLHIDGNIIQSGSTYVTNVEQVTTTKDYIILREGAVGGLGNGDYSGFEAVKYDGVNNGRLVFDNQGIARVGDIGSEQPLTTRIESPTNGYIPYWESANNRLNFKLLTISDISNLNTWSGSTNINLVGTITGGTWNGTIISPTYGGTGVNNGNRTLSVLTNSGGISFSNASTTLTVSGNTNVSGSNTGDQTIRLSGDVTTTNMTNGTYIATMPDIATSGIYNVVYVNSKGQVVSGTTVSYGTKITTTIVGNGTSTTFTLVHNLNTNYLITSIIDASTGDIIELGEIIIDSNTLQLSFNTAPTNGKTYLVTIVG